MLKWVFGRERCQLATGALYAHAAQKRSAHGSWLWARTVRRNQAEVYLSLHFTRYDFELIIYMFKL